MYSALKELENVLPAVQDPPREFALLPPVPAGRSLRDMTVADLFQTDTGTFPEDKVSLALPMKQILMKFHHKTGNSEFNGPNYNIYSDDGYRKLARELAKPKVQAWLKRETNTLRSHFQALLSNDRIMLWRGLTVEPGFEVSKIYSPLGMCWTWDKSKATSYDGNYSRVGLPSQKVKICVDLHETEIDWPPTFRLNIVQGLSDHSEREIRPRKGITKLNTVEIDGVSVKLGELLERNFEF